MLIIKNARLIPDLTVGYSDTTGEIIVDGNKIVNIVPVGTTVPTAEDTVIDAAGKTVMPGIMDIHMHFGMLYINKQLPKWGPCKGQYFFECIKHMNEYLKQGYTTLREMGSQENIALTLRDSITRGDLKGPRIISSGLIMSPTAIGNEFAPDLYEEADSPDQLRYVARKQIQDGVDVLKYMATGAMLNRGGYPGARVTTKAELETLVELSKIHNIPVGVHCHGTEAIDMCVDVGINTIEHATLISDETIQKLLDGGEKSYLVPTIGIGYTMLGGPTWKGFEYDENKERSGGRVTADKAAISDQGYRCMMSAYKAGLTLGFGSDIPMEALINSPGLEFTARQFCCDFENIDMLKQATINSAKIVGIDDQVGTIEVGKLADIIIVDGNPDEDIKAMTKPMIHVIRDGDVLI